MCRLDAKCGCICGDPTSYFKGEPFYTSDTGKSRVLEYALLCGCLPIPIPNKWACGLPADAQPLSEADKQALLTFLSGNWEVTPLFGEGYSNAAGMIDFKNKLIFEKATVFGGQYTMSGGMHNRTQRVDNRHGHGGQNTVRTSQVNDPKTYDIIPFKSNKTGMIYIDNIGPHILTVASGEFTLVSAIPGVKYLLQRGWKKGGFDQPAREIPPPYSLFGNTGEPPQQTMHPHQVTVNIIGSPSAGAAPPQYGA
uniref:Uncharacterized protein n=1 Tax=Chromera velia CCMP2878 TaxID=1169474 RepID=A0A0G4H426_9ALVE|mmetsp:Transcript_43056/g.84897  ORF Transcript_43056/g.84897 Transcript_43056/m.84897 type:complete len:252 (+) Transcript_43056:181-936(+)|eukprot:Cvel_24619.t1-p1 / transcript=Cvel_24619.t1 / gene=Cvel_24619 / organism=Chromera_velia_CCMP2878 / gene_product=hypothetical protein / transcript_product=hypothetical protein / location=Cvel_scaffold2684:16047-16799(-) / protein_length=251 / sequence_SO=supercontig / SO=protein_coding / is_pseudo=false